MKIVCVTLLGEYNKRAGGLYSTPIIGRTKPETKTHFQERDVEPSYFYGLRAGELGLQTIHPYELDNPGSGFNMGPHQTGCWLSHRTLWSGLLLLQDDAFFIIEDDAVFPPDWRERLERNMRALPEDWDIFYVGSCCAGDKPKTHVEDEVYEVKYPFCTHGYMVRRKALMTMIEKLDEARCYAPIDIALVLHVLPHLKTYTLLPRLLEQFNTSLLI